MSMDTPAAGRGRISIYRADSHQVKVSVKERDPSFPNDPTRLRAMDMTGATMVLSVRKTPTGAVLISRNGTIVSPPGTDGKILFELIPNDTAALAVGQYTYDVQVTLPGSVVYTVLKDVFEIKQDVTP